MIAAGSLQLTRPGYSVDEEFTVFAVRGIQAHGLPVLPSGLLYDRGIAYSYAAWLAGAVTGSELPAFRAVALFSAAVGVLLTFFLVRRIANDTTAVVASLLIALSVPFWATATTARFYAPFLGAYLLTLYFLTHRHWWIGLIAAAAIARLTHELAFTLVAIPVLCWLLDRRRPSTMVCGDAGRGWRAGDRASRPVRACTPRAIERRHDGAALLSVAGDQPVRASRRSPVRASRSL